MKGICLNRPKLVKNFNFSISTKWIEEVIFWEWSRNLVNRFFLLFWKPDFSLYLKLKGSNYRQNWKLSIFPASLLTVYTHIFPTTVCRVLHHFHHRGLVVGVVFVHGSLRLPFPKTHRAGKGKVMQCFQSRNLLKTRKIGIWEERVVLTIPAAKNSRDFRFSRFLWLSRPIEFSFFNTFRVDEKGSQIYI